MPPADGSDPTAPPEPVSLDKPAVHGGDEAPPDFDPYRFGAPDHPIPPEYAPPGYRPPAPAVAVPSSPPGYGTQPYGAPPPPPPQFGYYAPARAGHGKATAALGLGIGSIVFCWLSIFDAILVILALVLGLVALSESRRDPRRGGRNLAIAGIACAVIGAILATVLSVVIYTRFKDCLDLPTGSQEYRTCITDKL